MKQEELVGLIRKLAYATKEDPRPGLAEEIKDHIPGRLVRHRVTWDTMNIVVDLRLSRTAAAAIILLSVLIISGLFRLTDNSSDSLYEDSRLLFQYGFAGENAGRSQLMNSLRQFYEDLANQGRDVVFYGENADPKDRHSILMHWKISNGDYRIIYNDLTARTVSPSALIRLQSRMLEKRLEQ
jgi:hypothetical protein